MYEIPAAKLKRKFDSNPLDVRRSADDGNTKGSLRLRWKRSLVTPGLGSYLGDGALVELSLEAWALGSDLQAVGLTPRGRHGSG